ncbi:MAG: acyl-CoA dehydrogenase family protein [Streptosporangiaceae bacterium]
MDFTLAGEQRQFAASLHEMLAAADGPAAARAWAAGNREPGLKIWRALADAGVTALAVPAESGGQGAAPVDLVIACEEAGHHAIPGPIAESLAAAPALLGALIGHPGSLELQSWLGRLAAGDLIVTVAAPPVVPYAADAEAAGLVLLADSAGVWIGAPALPQRSVDAARTLSEVTATRPLAQGPDLGPAVAAALDYGTLACAAQLLGAGQALLEGGAAHARQRVQFGQPVGSFQAVQHQLADALIKLEFARPLLYAAAVVLASGSPSARRDVSAAKIACGDAAYRAGRVALQVHGAIGYTAEADTGLWLTKVQALRAAWGTQAHHRARVLAALTGRPAAGRDGGAG